LKKGELLAISVGSYIEPELFNEVYLLAWEGLRESAMHIDLLFDAKLLAALLANTLLPEHMLSMENKWL